MEPLISITVSTQQVAEHLYRRIVGEMKASGRHVAVYIEGNTIRIPYVAGMEEVIWRVVKSYPLVAFSSIDLK
jgi:hypothetical protein